MPRCWSGTPDERPNFSELSSHFENLYNRYNEIPRNEADVTKKDPGICGDIALDETNAFGSSTQSIANFDIGESMDVITLSTISSMDP